MKTTDGRQIIARNRKARHDYAIETTYEVGLVLTGTEVKSLREGRASLVEGFAVITDNEVWLHGVTIPEYLQGTWNNHSSRRPRKLLLHRREILRIAAVLHESPHALVPLELYFRNGIAKLELAVARGKKSYDKRHDLAKRDAQREIERAVSDRYKRGRVRG